LASASQHPGGFGATDVLQHGNCARNPSTFDPSLPVVTRRVLLPCVASQRRRCSRSWNRRQRSQLAGYADEVFYSFYRVGVLRLPDGDGLLPLLEAWQRCPHRWEPVHEACRWLNEHGLYKASYALSRRVLAKPCQSDRPVRFPRCL